MRMATTPQMTFSSQSQQFTWCRVRGMCSSWFLQTEPAVTPAASCPPGNTAPAASRGGAWGPCSCTAHAPCTPHSGHAARMFTCSRGTPNGRATRTWAVGKGYSRASAAVTGMQVQGSASRWAFREPQRSLCLHQCLRQFLNINPFGKNLIMFYDETIMINDK